MTSIARTVAALSLLALTTAASAAPLTHAVFFTLAQDTAENRDRLVAACEEHLSGHEGTLYFSVGVRAEELNRAVNDTDFDVALLIVFDGKASHDAYQKHPRHLRFVEVVKELRSGVRVFDSLVSASATP